MSMPDTLLNQAQVAKALGVHVQTLGTWRRKGIGPRWQKLGEKLIRYSLSDVEEFIATSKQPLGEAANS
jgi:predicted DNA-binding transcriptional regulator AlpA